MPEQTLLPRYIDNGPPVKVLRHPYPVRPVGLAVAKKFDPPNKVRIPRGAPGGIVAAGIVVRAKDTGRVLMLQRAVEDKDPAAGMWEFPGGKLESGEKPKDAARREWEEETGCELPDGEYTGKWNSPDGVYRGYVYSIPSEAGVDIHGDRDDVTNPDDPDGDHIESLAWWAPQHLEDNPAVREELRSDLDGVLDAIDTAPGEWAGKSDDDLPGDVDDATMAYLHSLFDDDGLERFQEAITKVEEGAAGRYRARHLIRWYEHGEGAARIRWGEPDDWDRCVRIAGEHMRPEQAKGFCNLRHHGALGIYPATHAAMERGKKSADDGVIAKGTMSDSEYIAFLANLADHGSTSAVRDQAYAELEKMLATVQGVAIADIEKATFDPAKHPRLPAGMPGGGRFRSIAQAIDFAFHEHGQGRGHAEPFHGLDRRHLLDAAKRHGLPVKRGESDDNIARALMAHAKAKASVAQTPVAAAIRAAVPPAPVVPQADPTQARKDMNEILVNIGRRKPTKLSQFDDAAQALANGEDRKTVASKLKRAATTDKTLSPEDLKTYHLLAAEIAKSKPRPRWLSDKNTITLDKLLEDTGNQSVLMQLEDLDARAYHAGDRSKSLYSVPRHKQDFEKIRKDLLVGEKTRAGTLAAMRKAKKSIQTNVDYLRRRRDVYGYRLSLSQEDELNNGSKILFAWDTAINALRDAKIPTTKKTSLGATEVGDVLPIDESRFKSVPMGRAVLSRGKALDPNFKHVGQGPAGGVVYLFNPGVNRPPRDGLTRQENKALDYYTVGRLARALNGSLRAGKNHHGTVTFPEIGLTRPIDLDEVRSDLDTAIENSELAHDTILWRGVLLKAADRNRLVPGAILSDHAYCSTSTSENAVTRVVKSWQQAGLYKGTKPVKFKILAAKGTHGAIGHEAAKEVLFPRDQKLRVIREEPPGPDGIPTFVMEAVPNDASAGIVRGRNIFDAFDYDSVPNVQSSWGSASIDHAKAQEAVYKVQGFDGLPKSATKSEMDEAIRRGAIELHRGFKINHSTPHLTPKDMADQFRTGDYYYGQGGAVYGRGTYAAPDRSFAAMYARKDGYIARMALRRDARVIHYEDLRKLHLKAMSKVSRDLDAQQKAELANVTPGDAAAIQAIIAKYDQLRAKSSKRSQVISDLGVFGALHGYDAIVAPMSYRGGKGAGQPTEYVILNRTALMVEE